MIKFISTEIQDQFNDTRLDPRVKMMTLLAASYIYNRFGEPLYTTSVYRPQNNKSVHAYWRGVDSDNDAGLGQGEKKEVADYLNSMFIYDPKRPEKKVCLLHSVEGRGGDHFHIQCHPNTKLNGEGVK